MLRTRSYWLTADAEERRAGRREQLRELFATHPDLAGRETVELPYRTVVSAPGGADAGASGLPDPASPGSDGCARRPSAGRSA